MDKEEIEKLEKMKKRMLTTLSMSGDMCSKIIIEWDACCDLFRKILDKNVKCELEKGFNSNIPDGDKILSFFTQIKLLTRDFKEELDKNE